MTLPGAEPVQELPDPVVHQQGTVARVARTVLAAILALGWLWEGVAAVTTAVSSTDTAVVTTVGVQIYATSLASLVTLFILIAGPQPRWATRWAWFWLFALGPMSAVFLLVEPVPVWHDGPLPGRPSRLTGGKAFLIVLGLGIALGVVAGVVVTMVR